MTYIALLRGINVGGNRKILMADLRKLFEQLGCAEVKTYIQSGNVFFDGDENIERASIEEKITQAILEQYGFEVPVIVRTVKEIKQAIDDNPYANGKESDINNLHLTFLKEVPDPAQVKKAKELEYSPDLFEVIANHVFIHYLGKHYTSKLNNKFFEKNLKVRATNRNWKTVNKLYELTK